jgi:hypothetical protein
MTQMLLPGSWLICAIISDTVALKIARDENRDCAISNLLDEMQSPGKISLESNYFEFMI